MCLNSIKTIFLFISIFAGMAVGTAQEISVYPHPQSMQMSGKYLSVNAGIIVKGKKLANAHSLNLIDSLFSEKNPSQSAAASRKVVNVILKKSKESAVVAQRSGAYRLSISNAEIRIDAFDQRSVFYAVQTLSQLVIHEENTIKLPIGIINDFPDVAFRGTVEGFYGEPWSHKDRIEQLRFYGKYKLNTYIYGPKDDPYHSSPHWRDWYPEEEAEQIKSLIDEADKNQVDFVWAIHPGKDIKWNKSDSNAVINKFVKMYDLGVRAFAVFFDDISGAGTDARKQADLLNFIKHEFADKHKGVLPLIMCPTEYNKSWANQERGSYLDILGDHLDPSIHVMWTGDRVISDNTLSGLEWVNERIKRPAYVWWNFPVSDYVRNHLLMGPAYGLDKDAAHAMSGFVSNPMDKAEASKIAIFSIANYSWNLEGYDSHKSWEKGSALLMPEAPEAFLLFNKHNSDLGPNGHGYRRDESVEIKPIIDQFLSSYKDKNFDSSRAENIKSEFVEIQNAVQEIFAKSKNARLIEQISSWLTHFKFLGRAGEHVMDMLNHIEENNKEKGWQDFLLVEAARDSMENIDRTFNQNPYQPGIKTGSLVLEPFIEELMVLSTPYFTDSLLAYGGLLSGSGIDLHLKKSATLSNSAVFKNQPLIVRNNYVAYSPILEVVSLEEGQYFGLEVSKEVEIMKFEVYLENEDLSKWGTFEASVDGKKWTKLSVATRQGKGQLKKIDTKIKRVRFKNTSTEKQEFVLKTFKVTVE